MAKQDGYKAYTRIKKEIPGIAEPGIFRLHFQRRDQKDWDNDSWDNAETIETLEFDVSALPEKPRNRILPQGAATVLCALQSDHGVERKGGNFLDKIPRMKANWANMLAGGWGMPDSERKSRTPILILRTGSRLYGLTEAEFDAIWKAAPTKSQERMLADEKFKAMMEKVKAEPVEAASADALEALLSK